MKKPKFGYDGWSALLICIMVYGTVFLAVVTNTPLPKATAVVIGTWIGSVYAFSEKNVETLHEMLKDFCRFYIRCWTDFIMILCWLYYKTKIMIEEVEGPTTQRVYFSVTLRRKSNKFAGQAINREVGLGWATGSYLDNYISHLNERRLEDGIRVHNLSVPHHKRWMFWKEAGLKKQNHYVNGISVSSQLFQCWNNVK